MKAKGLAALGAAAAILGFWILPAASAADNPVDTDPVVVTATRIEEKVS
ncbi:MAG: hypothetical protein H6Q84_895, partial [Deltaproteobacteria bacterium]|nr:hypothetical protein [Deltaproteobacteria bacterium]